MDAESQDSLFNARLRQYRTLVEVAESISAQRDLPSLLQKLREQLQLVVKFDGIRMVLHDPQSNRMRMHILELPSLQHEQLISELPIEESLSGWVWQNQQPVLITDLDAYESRYPQAIAELRQYNIKTVYILPLTSMGRPLGALGFGSLHEDAWSEEEQDLLQQVAKLVAVAVDNTVNFENALAAETELKRRLEQLRLLLNVGNSIVSHLNLRDLIQAVSDCLRQVIACDGIGMTLYDQQTGQLRVYSLDPKFKEDTPLAEGELFPLEGTPGARALKSLETVLVTSAELENSSSPLVRRIAAGGIKSGCVAPLISHGRALGTIDLASKREDAFTKDDAELLTQIAGQIAIAVDNASNFERARAAEQELARNVDRLRLMLRINNAVVSQLDLWELLRIITSSVRAVVKCDTVGVALFDHESGQLRTFAADVPPDHPFRERGVPIPLEGNPAGLSYVSGQPVFIAKPDFERFTSPLLKRLYDDGYRSGGSVPLIAHGRKLGVLGVSSKHEDAFSDDDKELLCQVANQVAIAVDNALAFREIETLKNKLASEKLYLEDEIRTEHNFDELIGESPTFRRILKQVETVAPTDSTVLICGETGTGKELLARAIHNLSSRRERTLVKINCAAIPTGLLESELFGHEKGAFTGAISQRVGRFELAHRGSLFLDEVGDIPLELQPKLLRVLQEQEFERLGSTRTQKVDVRLIAATNCDLEQMVADKKYRSDLYYRLNVFPLTIPPLRERREDVPALTRFFTQKYARRLKKQITAITAEVMAALTGYHWPGNVRELEHFVERAVILTRGSDLEIPVAELKSSEPVAMTEISTLQDAEREHILRALEETKWVIGGPNGAATRLGMKRTTLQSRMQKLGISRQN